MSKVQKDFVKNETPKNRGTLDPKGVEKIPTPTNGGVYFCLPDVATILEISNTNPSRFSLDEAGVHKMYISYPSGSKQVTFIN